MRHLSVSAFLQIALSLSAVSPAFSQNMASAADGPAAEHVRHLRSRKVAKPMLTTDDDRPEPGDAAGAAPAAAQGANPVTGEASRAAPTRQKKATAKPAAPKQRAVARKEISRPEPSAEVRAPAPASRGLLEDLFGDN